MPILVPYGDPQMHGTLAKSISFRRWRGKVVMEKKPHGRQPNTPGQIAIRDKFKQAWQEWYALNVWELEYLETKSTEKGMTPSNLWIQMYMKDIVWSHDPLIFPEEILNMDLPDPIGEVDEAIHFTIFSFTDTAPPPKDMGSIWDADNTFTPGMTVTTKDGMYIEIESPLVTPFTIPFNYPILIEYQGATAIPTIQLVKLPELTFPKNVTPSNTPMNLVKEIVDAKIVAPIGIGEYDLLIQASAFRVSPLTDWVLLNLYDNQNIKIPDEIAEPYQYATIEFQNQTGSPITVPEGYAVSIRWKDFSDLEYDSVFLWPEVTLNTFQIQKLYLADDWSLYYDQAMTNLANSPVTTGPYQLYLASDWSLYYDINLTLLANTPIL